MPILQKINLNFFDHKQMYGVIGICWQETVQKIQNVGSILSSKYTQYCDPHKTYRFGLDETLKITLFFKILSFFSPFI